MRISLLIASLLLSFNSYANEQIVSFMSSGQKVIGTLALPVGDPAPVVLMLHGFTGARDELKTDHVTTGVFARTAQQLVEQGYASLRIDFRGSGESIDDLTFAQTTFDSQIADALAAIEYLKSSEQVLSDELHLLGWSQGGLVASAVAGRGKDVDVVALWAAVGDPMQTYTGILGDDVISKGMDAGSDDSIAVELPWTDIELNGAFFDGIESFNTIDEIAAYSGPLFVGQGTQDTTVLPESADRIIEAHDGPELLWTSEMDHVFNTFTTEKNLDELVEATINFFKQHDD